MKNDKYWIWLQSVVGAGRQTADILSFYKDAKSIYDLGLDELRESGLFTSFQLAKAKDHDLSSAEKIISDCEENHWKIINFEDADYPAALRKISDFPLGLYVDGDEKLLNNAVFIGVIGTRKPSQYGIDVAYTFTRGLVEGKAVIVSGGALGIDSVAHNTAIECGGKTILILGNGLGDNYMPQNKETRKAVAMFGALVSEFPPFTPPTRNSFLMRNRITAGLCNGVLVIEAGERSGTLSTARKAFKYQKDVFVVTGDVKGPNFLGAHELVKEGANVVFSSDDILTLYGYEVRNKESFYFSSYANNVFEGIDDFPYGKNAENEDSIEKTKESSAKPRKKKVKETKTKAKKKTETKDISFLDKTQRSVYDAICRGNTTLDDIAKSTNTIIREILTALTILEINDLVELSAGNEYILK